MITATRAVMTRLPSPDQDAELRVTFALAYEDTGTIRHTVTLDHDEWQRMGEPEHVTATIEPGDTINADAVE